MKIGKKRMLSDVDFTSKSHSAISSDSEQAPPSSFGQATLTSLFSKPMKDCDSFKSLEETTQNVMTKEEMKQLLIKAIVPEVVSQLNSFAQ